MPALSDPPERVAQLRLDAARWPSHDLTLPQLTDLELLLTGALGPVRGYLTQAEVEQVVESARLPGGAPCPVPVTLEVPTQLAAIIAPGDKVGLRDPEGVLLAVCRVAEVAPNRLAGPVEGVALPTHHDFAALRATPTEVDAEMSRRGWARRVAVSPDAATRPTVLPAVRRLAAELGAPLLVLPAMRPHPVDDPAHYARARAFAAAVGADEILALLSTRWSGADDRALLHRVGVSAAYGATDVVVPPGQSAATRTLYPDVGVHELATDVDAADHAAAAGRRGVTVFFTGLSGAGKSTIAGVLVAKLLERGERTVSLLDGDLVRKQLSSELTFSRAHRDLNIRRIGYVAAEITKHGGIAVCAPIAPYEATRRAVRELVSAYGGFLLVHVTTSLDVCEQRDRKGLYAKARAGVIPEFTGVSDPYEPPVDADISLDTGVRSPEQAADVVISELGRRGWL